MKDVILTDRGPKPIGPYSQAIRTNAFLYVSGQVALDSENGGDDGRRHQTADGADAGKREGNCGGGGLELASRGEGDGFSEDMNDFGAMNEVYAKYFTLSPPARSTVQVARLPKDALVESK